MLGYKKEFFFGIYEKSDWIVSETYKRCKEFQNINKFKDETKTKKPYIEGEFEDIEEDNDERKL